MSQEILHKSPGKRPYFLGRSLIIDNRYVVSTNGEIFDLATRTLYAEHLGIFSNYENGRVYIVDQYGFGGIGTTRSFDLTTKKYQEYHRDYTRSNFNAMGPGPISPDGKRIITSDRNANRIIIVQRDGESPTAFSTKWARGQFKMSCGKKCNDLNTTIPAVWIDNDRYLTQRSNGHLVVYDYRTEKWSDLVRIPLPDELPRMPVLTTDATGAIFYTAGKVYRIDVEKREYSETNDFGLGHGFIVSGQGDMKRFAFGEKDLATFISGTYFATDGYLAAEYQELPLTKSVPTSVRVWANESGTWTTLGFKFYPRIIGWHSE